MTRPDMQISRTAAGIPEALSIYMNQLVYDQKRKGRDITVLSLGEAFFDIPMFDFSAIDFVKGYHYSDSQGIPELRHKIAGFYGKQYGAPVNANTELLISAGSKVILYLAMQATVNPGEEILIHEPAWLSYQEQARIVGAVPRFIPYDCPVEQFGRYMTDRTRMMVINNPNNPAGRLYREPELQALYEICRSRGVYILVDEAYSDFLIDEPFVSMARVAPDKSGVIVANSLSKNMGMSGWRVGYAISTPDVIQAILRLNQHVITCASTVLLLYMARYFDDVISRTLPQVAEVVKKRERIAKFMDGIGLQRLPGGSTFYFFVRIDPFPGTDLELALHLLFDHQISVVPGSAYGESTRRFVRVGIGTEPEERIHDALHILRDALAMPSFDGAAQQQRLDAMGVKRFVVPPRVP
ncbi:MAG: pyridoxal phosphate-dependent aminotransferase [Kiritimatiellae bacterium]|nr:pyridoxal phosphate-dependent aminotransferase [Kiritimatiellia bacterium]